MAAAPLLPSAKPGMKRPSPVARTRRSDSSVASSSEYNQPVEIVTPDRHCAELLLEYAASIVPAELLPGAGWIVRLQAPPAGRGGWSMLEVLSLLDRWLESVPNPCARVLYSGHSYLIRSSNETRSTTEHRDPRSPQPTRSLTRSDHDFRAINALSKGRYDMLLLILLVLLIIAIGGGLVVSKFLFLLIVVAIVVFAFSRMGSRPST